MMASDSQYLGHLSTFATTTSTITIIPHTLMTTAQTLQLLILNNLEILCIYIIHFVYVSITISITGNFEFTY
jgi:hypothetical protein